MIGTEIYMRTKIVYEDNFIIVAHKPAGLATQTARVGQSDMVSELKNYLAGSRIKDVQTQGPAAERMPNKGAAARKQDIYIGIIHRLDQPVEGLLIFAKDKRTAAALTAQLGQGTMNKQYYAVICGRPSADEGELVDYLRKESNGVVRVVTENCVQPSQVHRDGSKGRCADEMQETKRAVLQYKVMKQIISTEQPCILMDIHIDTGRFHQIRAQMAHAGMPLLGDAKYGNEISMALSRELGVRNVALCAYHLEFVHPMTKKKMCFQVEPEGKIFDIDRK